LADFLFNDTVKAILNAKGTTAKNVVWNLLTWPAKNLIAHCPVDIYVYNAQGNLCGSIEDNVVTKENGDFTLSVEGDTKYVTGMDYDYTVKYVATGDGLMDIEVTEYMGTDMPSRHLMSFSIPLYENGFYVQQISEAAQPPAEEYQLVSETNQAFPVDITEILYTPNSDGNGSTPSKLKPTMSFAHPDIVKTEGEEPFINDLTTDADGKISYTSGDESVATVDSQTGKVTIVGVGTTTITVVAGEGENYAKASGSYTLTVVAEIPTAKPTEIPTIEPTQVPTIVPTQVPTIEPTEVPTIEPTQIPTIEPIQTPTTRPTQAPIWEPSDFTEPTRKPLSVKVGKKITIKNNRYKVTSIGSTGAVRFLGVKKKTKSVVIPASVKIRGKNYKVTSIAAKALYKNKKLKKLKVGKNVKKIGKNAFRGCKKLRWIVIKTKKLTFKNVGKNAFKGLHRLVRIYVPKSKLKLYDRIIRARGIK